MSGSEARDTLRLERQRLIERLNTREAELTASQSGRPTRSEEGLEEQIEKERQLNQVGMGFA